MTIKLDSFRVIYEITDQIAGYYTGVCGTFYFMIGEDIIGDPTMDYTLNAAYGSLSEHELCGNHPKSEELFFWPVEKSCAFLRDKVYITGMGDDDYEYGCFFFDTNNCYFDHWQIMIIEHNNTLRFIVLRREDHKRFKIFEYFVDAQEFRSAILATVLEMNDRFGWGRPWYALRFGVPDRIRAFGEKKANALARAEAKSRIPSPKKPKVLKATSHPEEVRRCLTLERDSFRVIYETGSKKPRLDTNFGTFYFMIGGDRIGDATISKDLLVAYLMLCHFAWCDDRRNSEELFFKETQEVYRLIFGQFYTHWSEEKNLEYGRFILDPKGNAFFRDWLIMVIEHDNTLRFIVNRLKVGELSEYFVDAQQFRAAISETVHQLEDEFGWGPPEKESETFEREPFGVIYETTDQASGGEGVYGTFYFVIWDDIIGDPTVDDRLEVGYRVVCEALRENFRNSEELFSMNVHEVHALLHDKLCTDWSKENSADYSRFVLYTEGRYFDGWRMIAIEHNHMLRLIVERVEDNTLSEYYVDAQEFRAVISDAVEEMREEFGWGPCEER